MIKKAVIFFIATTLTFSLNTARAQITNANDGMDHIIKINDRLAMTFNTNDEIFSKALRNATATINDMDIGQSENVLYSQTAVSIELLEEYNDDDDLPCKKALMTSSEEGVAYYIYVCRQEDGSDQVSLQSDLPSVLRQKQ
jgi:hypothetical protein